MTGRLCDGFWTLSQSRKIRISKKLITFYSANTAKKFQMAGKFKRPYWWTFEENLIENTFDINLPLQENNLLPIWIWWLAKKKIKWRPWIRNTRINLDFLSWSVPDWIKKKPFWRAWNYDVITVFRLAWPQLWSTVKYSV